jgi:O-antigen ligase
LRAPSLSTLALLHAALVAIVSSWLLGGIGSRNEWIIAALSAPAFALIVAEACARLRGGDRAGFFRVLRWCAPLVLLALLVIVSALNPSHRPAFIFDRHVLRPVAHIPWLPASANAEGSLRLLACFGGLAATGLALAFCVQSRRALRGLVLVLALNALALAVLGTVQHQTGASGPYFGAAPRDHPAWFATFLYHNHWSAFAVLQVAAMLGLVFHSLRQAPDRGWWHSPGPLLALAAILLAASVPLSTSRSGTLLMLGLAAAAGVVTLRHAARAVRRRGSARAGLARMVALIAVLALGGLLVATQGRDILAERLVQTRDQLTALQTGTAGYSRADLYADTWRMAADKPAFGWGLESYGRIFLRYSTFRPGIDGLWNTFEDAHSDWLQSLAEIGFVGTTLLLVLGLLPLLEAFRRPRPSPFALWLLGGCALVAAYAWLEFPFANPAVVATWWILWFAAIRHLQLSPTTQDR